MSDIQSFMQEAINMASDNIDINGGPFGAVITFENKIIAKCGNTVTLTNDPTAHAEINAIRQASKYLQTFDLPSCILFTSCEPCPMCLSAIYWARIPKVYYAATKTDAHNIGFDDEIIYKELDLPIEARKISFIPIMRDDAMHVFTKWENTTFKKPY